MRFIADTLGVKTVELTWENAKSVPYSLSDDYEIKMVSLDGIVCLVLTPKTKLKTVSAIKKQISRLQNIESCPIILALDSITQQRREAMIKAGIPFFVEDKQIYLPFLGIVLQERFSLPQVNLKKLKPSAQMLLFSFLYSGAKDCYISKMANKLGFTSMSISRAAHQLEMLGMVNVKKHGVKMVIFSTTQPKEIYEKAIPFLINPVQKKIYIEKDELPSSLLMAGLTALSKRSMMNPHLPVCYAGIAKELFELKPHELIDTNTQAEIEIWKYDPRVLSDESSVDPLSLAVSLADNHNERVEQMVDEMLERLWDKKWFTD